MDRENPTSNYLPPGEARVNGKAYHVADRRLAKEAKSMVEPDWRQLTLSQLVAAERMALHRLSGGEAAWRGVLERIRKAMLSKDGG